MRSLLEEESQEKIAKALGWLCDRGTVKAVLLMDGKRLYCLNKNGDESSRGGAKSD